MSDLLPLPDGSDDDVAAVAWALTEYGYTFDRVARQLGLRVPNRTDAVNGDWRSQFREQWFRGAGQLLLRPEWNALDVLIGLFEMGRPVLSSLAERTLGGRVVDILQTCGLVRRDEARLHPRFLVGTVDALRIVTDTDELANDSSQISAGPNPLVMPVYLETHLFAAAVNRRRCAWGLDVCTGNGVHALLLSFHCAEVIGTDVSHRALKIADFNARLNGIHNVEFRHGPVLEPVAGRRFDVITANPPYQPEPAGTNGSNWWGAPSRGEGVWRPMVEQLHRHLTPGGECFIILQGLSWSGDPFLDRVRGFAPTLAVEFDRFGSPDLASYRARYAEDPQFWKSLTAADYGVVRLASTERAARQEAS